MSELQHQEYIEADPGEAPYIHEAEQSHIVAYPDDAVIADDGALRTFIFRTELSLAWSTIAQIGIRTMKDPSHWTPTGFQLGKQWPKLKEHYNFKIDFESVAGTATARQGSVTRSFTSRGTKNREELSLLQKYESGFQVDYRAVYFDDQQSELPRREATVTFYAPPRGTLLTVGVQEGDQRRLPDVLPVEALEQLPTDALGMSDLSEFKRRAYCLAGATGTQAATSSGTS